MMKAIFLYRHGRIPLMSLCSTEWLTIGFFSSIRDIFMMPRTVSVRISMGIMMQSGKNG